ncbi:MAG: hypothetical protein Q8918_17640 [Bacteroidota bacterium]|nr:hypothetical protein [Bacteroidota bacterium]
MLLLVLVAFFVFISRFLTILKLYRAVTVLALDTGLQSKLGSSYKGLYNGNISSIAVNIGILVEVVQH